MGKAEVDDYSTETGHHSLCKVCKKMLKQGEDSNLFSCWGLYDQSLSIAAALSGMRP